MLLCWHILTQNLNLSLTLMPSTYGIRAVLSQIQDGQEQLIAYGSKSFTKEEQCYCVTQRELLAVVYITKYYRHYLYGRNLQLEQTMECCIG